MTKVKSTKLQDIWTLKLAAVETARHQCAL